MDDLLLNPEVRAYSDEPPNEATHLGALAGHSELLASMPVVGAPRGVAPNETIAAPGELAGLIDALDRIEEPTPSELAPLVDDLSVPPTGKPRAFHTESAVRRALAAPLPASLPPVPSSSAGEWVPPAGRHPGPSRGAALDGPPAPDRERRRNELRRPPVDTDPDRVFSPKMEETKALLESFLPNAASLDPHLSMPGMPVRSVSDLALPPEPDRRKAETFPLSPAPTADAGTVVFTLPGAARRWAAIAIDALVVITFVLVPALLGVFGDAASTSNLFDPDDLSALLVQGELTAMLAAGAGLMLLFSAASHAAMGRSLGELAMGLELIRSRDGERPGAARCVLRAVASLVGLVACGAGYLWILLDRRARTLHDRVSGTTVVRANARRESVRAAPGFTNEPTM